MTRRQWKSWSRKVYHRSKRYRNQRAAIKLEVKLYIARFLGRCS